MRVSEGCCQPLSVVAIVKLIKMRSKYTKNTFQTELITETSRISEVGPAKIIVLLENETDFVEREAACSLKLSGSYEKNSPSLYSLKMLKDC